MPSLEKRNGGYRIVFRFAGQKLSRSLKTRNEPAAQSSLARLTDNLRRVQLGLLQVPDGADVVSLLLSDGRIEKKPSLPKIRTLKQLFEAYLASVPAAAIEQSTRRGMETHIAHLKRVFGSNFAVAGLSVIDLQQYADTRAKAKGNRGKSLSAATIKKELVTFRTAWNWGREAGLFNKPFPLKAVRLPKTEEKPPFQTWQEIERTIRRGGLTPDEVADLWDSLFLTLPEIAELLEYVRTHARHPFVYPMFAFAAHTGARRSEVIRSRIQDLDLEGKTSLIREKKRVRGKATTRRVPLSETLLASLKTWLVDHPGGLFTFCHGPEIVRSKKKSTLPRPITRDEAHDHFKRALQGSKWEKLRGWHVFRHSFCSNCAAEGIDQRIVNAWVGHQTEEMVRRYRHLIPNQEQLAIEAVFGNRQQPVVLNAG